MQYINDPTLLAPCFVQGDALNVLACHPNGIVLDPFVGTGTTSRVAVQLNRGSIGIDVAREYLELAENRSLEYVCLNNRGREILL